MFEPNFRALEQRLLQGGVAARHVRSIIKGLRSHYADLVQKALEDGVPPGQAREWSRQRLGSDEQIVGEALARPELMSWGHRWPWAVYGAGPAIAYLLFVIALVGFMAVCLNLAEQHLTGQAFYEVATVPPIRFLMEHFTGIVIYPLSIATAVAVSLAAARRNVGAAWPVVGVALMAVLGGGADLHFVIPATPDGAGSFGGGWGASLMMLSKVLLTCVAALIAGILWRRSTVTFAGG